MNHRVINTYGLGHNGCYVHCHGARCRVMHFAVGPSFLEELCCNWTTSRVVSVAVAALSTLGFLHHSIPLPLFSERKYRIGKKPNSE